VGDLVREFLFGSWLELSFHLIRQVELGDALLIDHNLYEVFDNFDLKEISFVVFLLEHRVTDAVHQELSSMRVDGQRAADQELGELVEVSRLDQPFATFFQRGHIGKGICDKVKRNIVMEVEKHSKQVLENHTLLSSFADQVLLTYLSHADIRQ